jgi:CRISPR-associated endonuclease/helicase Cas3
VIGFTEFLAEVADLEADGTRAPAAVARVPYRWQEKFALACLDGRPPRVVGVPTGSGKTTAVDALVWALAAQLAAGSRRTLGVRIVWAIDRRILVDEVHEHASRLARRLDHALADVADPLNEAATALTELSGGRPLVATRWRGGLEERTELQSPLQAEVITSTVAQIGSRLLFRGYGVGRRSLSLAAGLAACDTTICLDEAHLADPFRQTSEGIGTMQRKGDAQLDLPGLRLIELTATPRGGDDAVFLSDEDKRQLGTRWNGAKSARLVTPESEKDGDRVKALVDECLDLVTGGATTLACVVNTVARARRVWGALGTKLGDDIDLGLLIGPQRQADRDAFLSPARRETLFAGAVPDKPLVVVATQTFEVGLDIDVEALVTESASAAALVQRLGRLNRVGRSTGTAVIVRDADSWLYGDDEKLAWEWLNWLRGPSNEVDVSVAALHEDPSRPTPSAPSDAPLLTPEVVECLVQTSPMPHTWGDPDVESYLKGAASDPTADVEICWRSDLRLDAAEEGGVDYSKMLVELAPPDRRELLKLNVLNARSLLAARLAGSDPAAARASLADTDIEGEAASTSAAGVLRGSDSSAQFLVVRYGEVHAGAARARGDDVISAASIAPGDLLVLPIALGGCDQFGLNPQAPHATDVARDADPAADGPVSVIRLTPGAIKVAIAPKPVPRRAVDSACARAWKDLPGSDRSQRQRILRDLVTKLARCIPEHRALVELAQRLADDDEQRLILSLRAIGPTEPDGTPKLNLAEEEQLDDEPAGEVEQGAEDAEEGGRDSDEAEDEVEHRDREPLETSWILRMSELQAADELDRAALPQPSPPTLTEHNLAVHDQLGEYVERLGLPPRIRDSLLLAAAGHDLGKADPRFQGFLHGGRAPLEGAPIAKSVFGTRDPRTARLAAKVSGLPTGFRHEIESVTIVANAVDKNGGADLDLALACIGGHHGQGLPVPGVFEAGGAPAQSFSAELNETSGVATGDGVAGWDRGEWLERFWRVVDDYGAWRFAYLLGLLILSDRIVSSRGG